MSAMAKNARAPESRPSEERAFTDVVRDYAIFRIDPQGTILSWNEGARAIKGYEADEIIGQNISRFYTEEARAAGLPQHLLGIAARDGRVEDEGFRVRKDGTRFWADVVITALRDDDGELVGFVKVTRDLTDRRAAEELLRQSEERTRLVIEAVQDYAIFMVDPVGRIATWNVGAARIKGWTADEIIGKPIDTFYTQDDRERGRPQELLRAARTKGRVEDEGWRVRKDGTRFWADVVITALIDREGELIGYAKVTRDLTDRRRAQQEIETRAAEQAAVAAFGVFALETRDLDAVMNRAVETVAATLNVELACLWERAGDELVLRGGLGWLPGVVGRARVPCGADPDHAQRSPQCHALQTGAAVVVRDFAREQRFEVPQLLLRHGVVSGVLVPIRAGSDEVYGVIAAHSIKPREFSPDDVHFMVVLANVLAAAIARRRTEEQLHDAEHEATEERRRTQRAEEELRERDEFISVAAHELRTPLTALQLRLQGLERSLRGDVETTRATRLRGALDMANRLGVLVERLLDLSRVVGGRFELHREQVDLRALVSRVVAELRDEAAHAGSPIQLEKGQLENGDERTAIVGEWDASRIQQALGNVLSNAIKYGAGHSIDLRITLEGDEARITVRDRGIGISPDDQLRIFERFQRAAPLRNYGGLGLGLYIARHVLEAHGGRIEVTSSPGDGSTFVLVLPGARAAKA